ncbi:formylglycine-generating enzyme family protein [bacterium]|nr:formylglycine-generating enzyme family protein [bacterium]
MKITISVFCLFFYLFYLVAPLQAQPEPWSEPLTGMEFVWVPAGSFLMGPSELEKENLIQAMGLDKYNRYFADELSRQEVAVAGFWVGKYEVTNTQYRVFVAEHDSKSYCCSSLNSPDQPVVEVSWRDAVNYARWLSAKCGKNIRLPREAEWEYACRAGTITICYWGDDSSRTCAYANVADLTAQQEWPEWRVHDCDDGINVTAAVGKFKPNSFGLYDMLGNVWEWCAERDAEFESVDSSGVTLDDKNGSSNYRVARGSCWDNPARYVRAASRNKRKPDFRGYNVGFRLVMIPDSK